MSTTTELVKQLREATYASFLDCVQALQAHAGDFDAALEQLRATNLHKAEKKAERATGEGLVIVEQSANAACVIELNCETDFVARTAEFKALAHRLADHILNDPALIDAESVLQSHFSDDPAHNVAQSIKELAGKLGENVQLGHAARYGVRPDTVVEGYIHAGAIEGYGPQEGRLGVLVELGVAPEAAITNPQALPTLAHNLALHIASESPMYVAQDDIPAAELDDLRAELTAQLALVKKPDAIKARIIAGRLDKFFVENCLLDQAYILDDGLTVAALLEQQSAVLGTAVYVTRFARFELNP